MSADGLGFLLAPAAAFLIAAGSPGPATLAVAATAMAEGRRAAICLGAGLALGLAAWGVVAATGFGALLMHWAPAMGLLKLAGGGYLLYLAWKSGRSALRADPPASRTGDTLSPAGLFVRGLLLNALNPKAVLAWTAVLAIGLTPGAQPAGLAAIVAVCALIGAAVYAGYAVAFSGPRVMAGYLRAQRGVDAALAGLFGLAGLRLILPRQEAP